MRTPFLSSAFSLILLITEQDLLVSPYGIDHLGLVIVALGNLGACMVKHCHGQSYLRPVMDGSAGRQARAEQMWTDALAEGVKRAFTDQEVERIGGEGATSLVEPESVC